MSSIRSKSHLCKNPLQSTIHQPLLIRTNKHRCFVFCLGHTSLTCVPGIGKKNKHLLNQSGINDLAKLYRKYRTINNIQRFQRWLERDIGFTSYQAKMTTCGIGSKLGDIKEINTGLIPICCSEKEKRNRSIESKENKKRKFENTKSEKLSPNSNQDRVNKHFPTDLVSQEPDDESLLSTDRVSSQNDQTERPNKLPDDHLTGVKSPDDPIFAVRPRSNPNKGSSEHKYKTNETSETKPMKLHSSFIIDEITHDNDTHLPKSKKQSYSSLDKSKISNTHLNKISSSTSERLKESQTSNNTDKVSSDVSSEFVQSDSNSDQQKSTNPLPHYNRDDFSDDPSKTGKLNEMFTSTKQKLQPTLDALQDKKDELLSASKYSPDASMSNEHSTKSILHNAQSIVPANTDLSYAAIKQKQYQQRTEKKPLKRTLSFDADSDKNDNKTTPAVESSRLNKLQDDVRKAVSEIMKQAAHIVHNKIQLRPVDSTLTRKKKSKQLASTQPPAYHQRSKDKKSIESNPNETLNSTQTQEELNHSSSMIHPSDNDVIRNPGLLSDTKIHNNRVQREQPTLIAQLPTMNKSLESMKIKAADKKKSLSTLSSLSDSNPSVNRVPSFIKKTQSTSSNVDSVEEETEPTTSNPSKFAPIPPPMTVSSPNTDSKKEKSDVRESQSSQDDHVTKNNLSETKNSDCQSTSNPSTPTPCQALWNNVSNEQILFQRRKPRFCLFKRDRFDRNQNHHSIATLFTDFTRQQYFKESESQDEHILYIKRLKTLYK